MVSVSASESSRRYFAWSQFLSPFSQELARWLIWPLGFSYPKAIRLLIARAEIADHRELRNAAGVGATALVIALGLQAFGLRALGVVAWPTLLCSVGLFIVWRGCGTEERLYLQDALGKLPFLGTAGPKHKRAIVFRCAAGLALIVIGIAGVASVTHSSGAAARILRRLGTVRWVFHHARALVAPDVARSHRGAPRASSCRRASRDGRSPP